MNWQPWFNARDVRTIFTNLRPFERIIDLTVRNANFRALFDFLCREHHMNQKKVLFLAQRKRIFDESHQQEDELLDIIQKRISF